MVDKDLGGTEGGDRLFAVEVDATGTSSAFSTVDAATVVVEAMVRSRSSTTAGVPDFRWERRFLLLADSKSSPPEVCSPSVFSILSFSRRSRSCLATMRSPPPTVLFLPNLGVDLSVDSELPTSLFIAIIRAAALFERKRPCKCLFCSASKVGSGVGGDVPGYNGGDIGDLKGCVS